MKHNEIRIPVRPVPLWILRIGTPIMTAATLWMLYHETAPKEVTVLWCSAALGGVMALISWILFCRESQ